MNLAKRKGEGKGKKRPRSPILKPNNTSSQITLDSGSILATIQDRVCELGLSFPTLDPTFPEVTMPGS
jgi:hypothetical protein